MFLTRQAEGAAGEAGGEEARAAPAHSAVDAEVVAGAELVEGGGDGRGQRSQGRHVEVAVPSAPGVAGVRVWEDMSRARGPRPGRPPPERANVACALPGFDSSSWYGLAASARTPAAIVALMHREVVSELNQPAMVSLFALEGAAVAGNTPQAFGQEIRDDITKWAKVIREANIRID